MTKTQLYTHAHGQTAYRHYINNPVGQTLFYVAGHKNPLDRHKSDLLRDICQTLGLNFIHFAYAGYDDSIYNGVPDGAEGYVQHWLAQALDFFDACVPQPCFMAGYSMGAYLALAVANARATKVKGVIGLASGFGNNLVQQIYDIYGGYYVAAYTNPAIGFAFEQQPNNSISFETKLTNITCPIFLNHAADDASVSAENMAHIKHACPHAVVEGTLSPIGFHQLNMPENHVWLKETLERLTTL